MKRFVFRGLAMTNAMNPFQYYVREDVSFVEIGVFVNYIKARYSTIANGKSVVWHER